LLVATALAIASRESGFGSGTSYRFDPRYSNWSQTIASELGVGDPSIGPTQIRFSNVSQSSRLSDYANRIGIRNPRDLSNWTKAILATVGMLANMYEDAKRLNYDTNSPGVNDCCSWTSTGNAALDLAIVGYNGGPGKVSNYCGEGEVKTRCDTGQISLNYIPRYGGGRGGGNTLLYVTGIASKLRQIMPEVTRVMASNRYETGPKGPPENPGQRRGTTQTASFDRDSRPGSTGPVAPNI